MLVKSSILICKSVYFGDSKINNWEKKVNKKKRTKTRFTLGFRTTGLNSVPILVCSSDPTCYGSQSSAAGNDLRSWFNDVCETGRRVPKI